MNDHLQAIITLLSLVNPFMCAAIFAQIEAGRSPKAQILVSADDQTLDLQRDALKRAKCRQISGVMHGIGGGTIKFAPNGAALSPPITGFTGMGVDGVGWGTGVANDKVWVTSFNGKIGVMDFNGNPVGQESDFPIWPRED